MIDDCNSLFFCFFDFFLQEGGRGKMMRGGWSLHNRGCVAASREAGRLLVRGCGAREGWWSRSSDDINGGRSLGTQGKEEVGLSIIVGERWR
ncbi:hypothetical protein GUJ93_ZPchr0224g7161 [Zizania palustris]|uniref:Uncharacterized protein n=1 Tax=Zizania palustris TaxID=103762 RepID=A0A8J5RE09_ZIZPA|nr:hypothetical protein GUJ93_ZPchr0224g7161 [Zizania palustris]